MARRQRNPDQLSLDFEAEVRERCQLLNAIDYQATGLTLTQWRHTRSYLKAVLGFSASGECFASHRTLAAGAELTYTTAKRAKAHALALGLVTCVRRSKRKGEGGRICDSIIVNWPAVATIPLRAVSPRVRAQVGKVRDQLGKVRDQVGPYHRGRDLILKLNTDTPSPSPHDALARVSSLESQASQFPSRDGVWQEVVEEVFLCGVNQATRAVNDCRTRGATVDDVRGLIAFWRQHEAGWQQPAYVLYLRLRRHSAGLAADAGWLPWTDEYSRNVDAATRRAKVDAELAAQLRARRARDDAWASLDAGTKQAIRSALTADYGNKNLQKSLDRVMQGRGSAEVEETLQPFRAAIERELARPHEPRVACIDGIDASGKRSGRVVVY